MRLWKQEAAALGDALERAEAEVFQRASEAPGWAVTRWL